MLNVDLQIDIYSNLNVIAGTSKIKISYAAPQSTMKESSSFMSDGRRASSKTIAAIRYMYLD